jgi:hypothetical protein
MQSHMQSNAEEVVVGEKSAAPLDDSLKRARGQPRRAHKVTDAQFLQVIGVRERYTKRVRGSILRARKALEEVVRMDVEYKEELAALEIEGLEDDVPSMATYARLQLPPMIPGCSEQGFNGTTVQGVNEALGEVLKVCRFTENLTVGTTRFEPSSARQQVALADVRFTPAGSMVIDTVKEARAAFADARGTLWDAVEAYDEHLDAAINAERETIEAAGKAAADAVKAAAALVDTDEAAVLKGASVAYEAAIEAASDVTIAALEATYGKKLQAAYDGLLAALDAAPDKAPEGVYGDVVAAFDEASGEGLQEAYEAALTAFDEAGGELIDDCDAKQVAAENALDAAYDAYKAAADAAYAANEALEAASAGFRCW